MYMYMYMYEGPVKHTCTCTTVSTNEIGLYPLKLYGDLATCTVDSGQFNTAVMYMKYQQ